MLLKIILSSMVLSFFLPLPASNVAYAQELNAENSTLALPSSIPASSIYWRDESVFDYGPYKTITINLDGTHYRGTLKKTGKVSWLFVYTGYLYKVGYDVYSNKEIE